MFNSEEIQQTTDINGLCEVIKKITEEDIEARENSELSSAIKAIELVESLPELKTIVDSYKFASGAHLLLMMFLANNGFKDATETLMFISLIRSREFGGDEIFWETLIEAGKNMITIKVVDILNLPNIDNLPLTVASEKNEDDYPRELTEHRECHCGACIGCHINALVSKAPDYSHLHAELSLFVINMEPFITINQVDQSMRFECDFCQLQQILEAMNASEKFKEIIFQFYFP